MKINFWHKSATVETDSSVPRYCKKCGAELPNTFKYKLCTNCRMARAQLFRDAGMGALALVGTVTSVVILKNRNSAEVTDLPKEADNDNQDVERE